RVQALWFWRKSEKSVDLALGEQLDRSDLCARHPLDVLCRIQSNERCHRADENVGTAPDPLLADGSSPQIGDAAYALPGEQLETADVNPGHNSNAQAPIDLQKKWTGEMQSEVEIAVRNCLGLPKASVRVDVNNFCEPLGIQQVADDVLRCDADARVLRKT